MLKFLYRKNQAIYKSYNCSSHSELAEINNVNEDDYFHFSYDKTKQNVTLGIKHLVVSGYNSYCKSDAINMENRLDKLSDYDISKIKKLITQCEKEVGQMNKSQIEAEIQNIELKIQELQDRLEELKRMMTNEQ